MRAPARARALGLALALVAATSASGAFAQAAAQPKAPPAAGTAPSTTGAAPSAAPGTPAPGAPAPGAPAPGAPSGPGQVAISDAARRHFRAGVLLLEDPSTPRYEEAYREFREAYDDSPSYKILGNLGLCAMKLERDDEAIAAYERYLKEGGDDLDPADKAQVERDLTTLRAGVVHVQVASDPPGAMLIDVRIPVQGESVTNTYGPIQQTTSLGLRQGHHRITARLAGRPDVVWEFDTSGGADEQHTFNIPAPAVVAVAPPPPTPTRYVRPVPTSVYVSAGVTGALLVGSVVTGLSALHQHDLYQEHNDGLHLDQAQSDRSAGRTLNVVTDVLLGATVVGAGLTTYLYLTRPGRTEPIPGTENPRAKSGPRVDVVPTWQASRPGVALVGAF